MGTRLGEAIPPFSFCLSSEREGGGCDWAMVPGNFQCKGVLLTWIVEGQGPTMPAVGAGVGYLGIFSLFTISSPVSGRRLERG